MVTTIYTSKDGTKTYRNNGRLHRLDGPAVIYADGEVEWWAWGIREKDPERTLDKSKEKSEILNETKE